jgi:hypothetical protein
VTRDALASLVDEYEAGLDAELQLLGELEQIAGRQREVSQAQDFDAFRRESERREQLTHSLLAIEERLKPVRETLAEHRQHTSSLPNYQRMSIRHREAQDAVARILGTDRESFRVMAEAGVARRAALAGLEQGEQTLAAYRKVLAPPAATPSLVDKRG